MSYQLVFWKSAASLEPSEVYAEVIEGHSVDGLEPIDPAVVEGRMRSAFPAWTLDASVADRSAQTVLSREHGALSVFYSPEAAVCTCQGLANADMNQIIDVFYDLGMRLYDPQTNQRFGS